MRHVTETYTCDICGCELEKMPFGLLDGNSVKIRYGVIARPIEIDFCDSCFSRMKMFCMNKGETESIKDEQK